VGILESLYIQIMLSKKQCFMLQKCYNVTKKIVKDELSHYF